MSRKILLFILLLPLLVACESRQETAENKNDGANPPAKAQLQAPQALLNEPISAVLVETPVEALPLWRNTRQVAPPLVLLSDSPFLKPIPEAVKSLAAEAADRDSAEGLFAKLPFSGANPLLLPEMAVSLALDRNLFSEVIWILPIRKADLDENLPLASFRQQMSELAGLTSEQTEGFQQVEGGFSGTLHGKPFRALSIEALPEQEQPVHLHIDCGYFGPLYKNEVKTPLFALIRESLSKLRTAGWQTYDVSISSSNFGNRVPVKTRFLSSTLKQLFNRPELLDEGLPRLWQLRRDFLYLEVFFDPDKRLEIAQQMNKIAPQDAGAKFDLYQALEGARKYNEAIRVLAEAVEIDRGYGLEYLNLAQQAMRETSHVATIANLEQARAVFPQAPLITLTLAETYLLADKKSSAAPLLAELVPMKWSPIYFPEMPQRIDQILTRAQQGSTDSP